MTARDEVARDLEVLRGRRLTLSEAVELRRDGEPVIRGTDVEVHRVAALIEGGMPVAEVVGDYAGELTAEAVEDAVRYARAHPKQGRPYPVRTAKAALRAGRGGLKRALAAASSAADG